MENKDTQASKDIAASSPKLHSQPLSSLLLHSPVKTKDQDSFGTISDGSAPSFEEKKPKQRFSADSAEVKLISLLKKYYQLGNTVPLSFSNSSFPIQEVTLVDVESEEKHGQQPLAIHKEPTFVESDSKEASLEHKGQLRDSLWVKDSSDSGPFLSMQPQRYSEKKPIALESLFASVDGKPSTQRILISGRIGVGKTMLSYDLAYRWSKPSELALWSQRFDFVFRISLKSWWEYIEGCHQNAEKTLDYFIYFTYVGTTGLNSEGLTFITSVLKHYQERTLLILDGYDEVADFLNSTNPNRHFLARALQHPQVIVTTRAHQLPTHHHCFDNNERPYSFEFHRHLENIGFSDQQLRAYLHQYFKLQASKTPSLSTDMKDYFPTPIEKQTQLFETYLKSHPGLLALARTPLNLSLMCEMQENKKTLTDLEHQTLTGFYRRVINHFVSVYHRKNTAGNEIERKGLRGLRLQYTQNLDLLGALAMSGVRSFRTVLRKKELLRAFSLMDLHVSDSSQKKKALLLLKNTLKLGFLRRVHTNSTNSDPFGQEYCFIHQMVQEFFAADYLYRCLAGKVSKQEYDKVLKGLKQCKYDQKYQLILSFVAGLCSQKEATPDNKQARDSFWHAMLSFPLDGIGFHHVRLIICCLNEARCDQRIPHRDDLLRQINQYAKAALELIPSEISKDKKQKQPTKLLSWVWEALKRYPVVLKESGVMVLLAETTRQKSLGYTPLEQAFKTLAGSSSGIQPITFLQTDKFTKLLENLTVSTQNESAFEQLKAQAIPLPTMPNLLEAWKQTPIWRFSKRENLHDTLITQIFFSQLLFLIDPDKERVMIGDSALPASRMTLTVRSFLKEVRLQLSAMQLPTEIMDAYLAWPFPQMPYPQAIAPKFTLSSEFKNRSRTLSKKPRRRTVKTVHRPPEEKMDILIFKKRGVRIEKRSSENRDTTLDLVQITQDPLLLLYYQEIRAISHSFMAAQVIESKDVPLPKDNIDKALVFSAIVGSALPGIAIIGGVGVVQAAKEIGQIVNDKKKIPAFQNLAVWPAHLTSKFSLQFAFHATLAKRALLIQEAENIETLMIHKGATVAQIQKEKEKAIIEMAKKDKAKVVLAMKAKKILPPSLTLSEDDQVTQGVEKMLGVLGITKPQTISFSSLPVPTLPLAVAVSSPPLELKSEEVADTKEENPEQKTAEPSAVTRLVSSATSVPLLLSVTGSTSTVSQEDILAPVLLDEKAGVSSKDNSDMLSIISKTLTPLPPTSSTPLPKKIATVPPFPVDHREVDVPGDHHCVFWCLVVGSLIDVIDRPDDFNARYSKLFGDDGFIEVADQKVSIGHANTKENIRQTLSAYAATFKKEDLEESEALTQLVRKVFRRKVVQYMDVHWDDGRKQMVVAKECPPDEKKMKENKSQVFVIPPWKTAWETYINGMGGNAWGDDPTIQAASEMLGTNIYVYSKNVTGVISHTVGGATGELHLIHTSVGEFGVANHYHYGIKTSIYNKYCKNGHIEDKKIGQAIPSDVEITDLKDKKRDELDDPFETQWQGIALYCLNYVTTSLKMNFWKEEGDLLQQLGQYDEAFACYQKAATGGEKVADHICQMGLLLSKKGLHQKALNYFSVAAALENFSQQASTYCLEGCKALIQLKQYEQAAIYFEKILKLQPAKEATIRRLGVKYSRTHEYLASFVCFRSLLSVYPKKEKYWFFQAEALRQLKQYSKAATCYGVAVKLAPTNAQYVFWQGVMFMLDGQYQRARTYFKMATDLNPKNADYWINRGHNLIKLAEYEKAAICIKTACSLDVSNSSYINERGVLLLAQGEYETALRCFQKASRITLANGRYFCNQAHALRELKRYPEAIACQEEAIKLQPQNAEYVKMLGVLWEMEGRFDRALTYFQEAEKLDPKEASYKKNQGNMLEELKRYEEAHKCYEDAARLEPENAEYESDQGRILFIQGHVKEALPFFERASRLDPTNPTYYYEQREAWELLRNYEKAAKCYQMACQYDPQNEMQHIKPYYAYHIQSASGLLQQCLPIKAETLPSTPEEESKERKRIVVPVDRSPTSSTFTFFGAQSRSRSASAPLRPFLAASSQDHGMVICRLSELSPPLSPSPLATSAGQQGLFAPSVIIPTSISPSLLSPTGGASLGLTFNSSESLG